ncbi:CYTH and CHAD domain-containing protein [Geminicoccus harenae]|uniref:CYTH and CHAD domain-containing protein n=2 Tax=Geminicoccus harenae TaxID=2498453 RepID=UPI001C985BE4|nr:CYTH and CHAD domain-containing protein [Geminicoccus harenae]
MGVERELKLEGRAEDLRKLLVDPAVADGLKGRPTRRRLAATYYDTPEGTLRRELGMSLRVRKEGRRWVQAVKREPTGDGVLLARDEWEVQVAGEAPEPARFTDPELADLVQAATGRELVAIVRTDIRRETVDLGWTDEHGRSAVVNLALDQGRIEADGRAEEVSELELELVEGDPACLYALALRCAELAPVRFVTQSKWQRGVRLHDRLVPQPVKAERPELAADANIETVMVAAFGAALRQWVGNEAAVLDGRDPEGIHQMRVALRRLRSLLTVFKDLIPPAQRKSLSGELRTVVKALGPARDLDVFEAELLAPVLAARAGEPSLSALHELATSARARAYDEAHAMVASRDYGRTLLRLSAWLAMRGWRVGADAAGADQLAMPATQAAAALLDKALRKVRRRGRHFAGLAPDERHEVRIALKKLRYAADAVADLFDPDRVKPYNKRLSQLQDHMGRFNDAFVAGALVDRLLGDAGLPAATRQAAAKGAGMVAGWHAHAAVADEPELIDAWRAFKRAEPFWGGTA